MEHFDPDIKYTAVELAGFIVSGTISGADGVDYARSMRDDIMRHVERLQDDLRAATDAWLQSSGTPPTATMPQTPPITGSKIFPIIQTQK